MVHAVSSIPAHYRCSDNSSYGVFGVEPKALMMITLAAMAGCCVSVLQKSMQKTTGWVLRSQLSLLHTWTATEGGRPRRPKDTVLSPTKMPWAMTWIVLNRPDESSRILRISKLLQELSESNGMVIHLMTILKTFMTIIV